MLTTVIAESVVFNEAKNLEVGVKSNDIKNTDLCTTSVAQSVEKVFKK